MGQEHPQAPRGEQRFQARLKLGQFRSGQMPFVGEDLPELGGEVKLRLLRHRRQPALRISGSQGPVKSDVDLHHLEPSGQKGQAGGALNPGGIDHSLPVGIIPTGRPYIQFAVFGLRFSVEKNGLMGSQASTLALGAGDGRH